jgi:hypothetical protein
VGVPVRKSKLQCVINRGEILTGWRTVLVVLLDDDAILSNAGESVTTVSHTRDGTSGSGDSLDADTVIAVNDLVVKEVDVADSVVRAATD